MGRYQPPAETEQIAATLKRAAAALRAAQIPFALAGSVACWARGGPVPSNDLDFAVAEHDAEAALRALQEAGMRGERPPEGWLLKAYDGDVGIDLIWDFEGLGDAADVIARADERPVEAVEMLVLDLEDVFVSRLCALTEHHLDLANPLAAARALREQVDWDEVRRRTECSPYAKGFLAMLEALGIIAPAAPAAQHPHARVRVVGGA
ncbi:MAG TPA: nucleotidyltransferase family protein [Solirubrobacteraceae bacterium]|nr:nucleotidyltransferase family protein [Solirubrobacteraceae bacterium]